MTKTLNLSNKSLTECQVINGEISLSLHDVETIYDMMECKRRLTAKEKEYMKLKHGNSFHGKVAETKVANLLAMMSNPLKLMQKEKHGRAMEVIGVIYPNKTLARPYSRVLLRRDTVFSSILHTALIQEGFCVEYVSQ